MDRWAIRTRKGNLSEGEDEESNGGRHAQVKSVTEQGRQCFGHEGLTVENRVRKVNAIKVSLAQSLHGVPVQSRRCYRNRARHLVMYAHPRTSSDDWRGVDGQALVCGMATRKHSCWPFSFKRSQVNMGYLGLYRGQKLLDRRPFQHFMDG